MNLTWTKTNAIIIDLDGTLANCDHRLHFVQGEKKQRNWHKFFKELTKDPVNQWCNEIINKFKNDHEILLVSGRPDTYKVETIKWLKDNKIYYNKLIMRKGNDHRKDSIIKQEIFENEIKSEYNIKFCVDDRPSVCRTWRELGMIVLQCNDKEF